MYQRRRRGPGIGLLFLLSQLYIIGFNRIPPVTLSFIGINVAVYLGLLNDLPSLGKACVSAQHVWFNGEWKRLLFAAFYHLDDFHLYYNMASFVWKGISLEGRMGSSKFLYILAVFTVLTNVVLVGLDLALANITGNFSYIYSCAAGFSGVIFALKVLTTYNLPSGVSMVMGMFPVPMRWACWAELVLIQLLVPNASFTGHLAGILVGLMYVKGPLKYVMDTVSGAGEFLRLYCIIDIILSYVTSVFNQVIARKLEQEQKNGKGGEKGKRSPTNPTTLENSPLYFMVRFICKLTTCQGNSQCNVKNR